MKSFCYDRRSHLLLKNPKVEVIRAYINGKNILMGVYGIKLPRISRMWLDGEEWGESYISLLLTDANGNSWWVGIKCAFAYDCLR